MNLLIASAVAGLLLALAGCTAAPPDTAPEADARDWTGIPGFSDPPLPIPPAIEDDEAPSTRLLVCTGGLPSLSVRDNAQGGCHSVDVSATETANADAVSYEAQAFTHLYRDDPGDDPACIFTATRGREGRPVAGTIGGGRDCRPEDTQCAYISEGWQVWAVTGKSCMEAGVPECTGPLCR